MYILYILAALWGIGDAVIQTQINGKPSSQIICHQTLQLTIKGKAKKKKKKKKKKHGLLKASACSIQVNLY